MCVTPLTAYGKLPPPPHPPTKTVLADDEFDPSRRQGILCDLAGCLFRMLPPLEGADLAHQWALEEIWQGKDPA